MKTFISFCVLLVSVSAFPQKLESTLIEGLNRYDERLITGQNLESTLIEGLNRNDERLITGSIVQAIENIREDIINAGLDPYLLEKKSLEYALPVPILFSVEALLEDVSVNGLSNIVIDDINYSILFNRLTFTIRLPSISISIGNASKDVTIFGSNTKSYASGSIDIVDIRLRGNIRVNIGIISGISIRSIVINFDLGDIISKLKIVINGKDVSRPVNELLGKRIPETLKTWSKEIDELLTIIGKELIEANL